MRFQMTVICAPTEETPRKAYEVIGRDVEKNQITMADAAKVIETEQWLERILGHRVHISQVQ